MNKTNAHPFPFVLRIAATLARIRAAFTLQVPVGYQDETGFHFGTRPVPARISRRARR